MKKSPSATSASPRTDSIIWLSSLESLEKLRLTTVCGVDIMQGDAVALKKMVKYNKQYVVLLEIRKEQLFIGKHVTCEVYAKR